MEEKFQDFEKHLATWKEDDVVRFNLVSTMEIAPMPRELHLARLN
jgi:hypothetical protein